MQYDIENKADGVSKGSESLRCFRNTINSREVQWLGLDIGALEKNLDKCVDHRVFSEKVKTGLLAEIVMSDALLYKDDVNQLLSHDDVRAHIRQEYDGASPERREQNEGLKRAYERLRNYEREQIVRGGRTADDVTLKKNIKAVLGKEMTEAAYKGIAPHKEAIPELVAKAKEKGLSAKQIKEAVHEARRIAKEKAESDKLQDKQNTLEKAGFVRIILNKKAKEK